MKAYTDGACRVSNPGQCSCAFAVYVIGCLQYTHARYLGPELHTNNFAEYSGLLDLLQWAAKENLSGLDIFCDSQLVVKTVTGVWNVKHEELQPLRSLAYALLVRGGHTLTWVRGHSGDPGNELCDKLCAEVLDKELNEQTNRLKK